MALVCHFHFILPEIKGNCCTAYKSPLPSPAFSKGFMGAWCRAAATLTPPQFLLSWGTMPLLSQGSWGEGSKARGLTKP